MNIKKEVQDGQSQIHYIKLQVHVTMHH